MNNEIKDLLALQEVDIRVRNMNARLKMLPEEMNKLKTKIKAEKARLEDAQDRAKQIELSIRRVESDVASHNSAIAKLNAQSMNVKKNDEYQAMMKEIETNKSKISELETEEIELYDAQEINQKEIKELSTDYSSNEKMVKEEMQEIIDLANEIKAEIEKLTKLIPNLRSKVSEEFLTQYDRFIGKNKGEPLSKIIDKCCGNCRLSLTPQVLNDTEKGKIANCFNCGFMVYQDC